LPGWKRDEWRKQAAEVSLVPPEKRTRTKDDDEDDWDMTLNRYIAATAKDRMGVSSLDIGAALLE
jgi:hypothetical protein